MDPSNLRAARWSLDQCKRHRSYPERGRRHSDPCSRHVRTCLSHRVRCHPQAYVAAFMRNIDWRAVEGRYQDATIVTPPRPLEQTEFGDLTAIAPDDVQDMIKRGSQSATDRHASASLHDARSRHRRGRGMARPRTHRRVDGHPVERSPRSDLLRLRLSYWLSECSNVTKGRIRRSLHGGWSLRVEGAQRANETHGLISGAVAPCRVRTGSQSRPTSNARSLRGCPGGRAMRSQRYP